MYGDRFPYVMFNHSDKIASTRGLEPRWITRSQLAARYQVHTRTIDEWRRLGYLPVVCIGTRLIRFDVVACDHWFNKFRHTAKWEQKEGGAR